MCSYIQEESAGYLLKKVEQIYYYESLLTEKHRNSEFHATRDHQANKSFDKKTHKYQYNIKNSNYKSVKI